ncbi:MAG: tetratricopeptide repeat protein [Bryobacteraceae bacterium]
MPLRTSSLLSLALIVCVGSLGAFMWWNARHSADTGLGGTDPAASPVAGVYADPAKCALCHAPIAATYTKTGMGRAFHRVGGGKGVGDPAPGKPYHHEASDNDFTMFERNGELFQRRWQLGPDGKETNVDEKRVDYVLGSGNHSRTYLHLTETGTLQQLPLAWYAENGGTWAMNPGYDRPDYAGSVRPIYYECMFCHNGYPKIPSGKDSDVSQTKYLQPLPEGIDCQRCHGPGQSHVDKASSGAALEAVRAAIVNPGKLNPERGMEVCLQCHLETSNQKLPTMVTRVGRIPFSYVPGQPLGDYRVAFDREKGNLENFEIAQGAYRLRASECFLKSEGKLGCTTCHNPHDVPRAEQATTQYNQVCLNCHQSDVKALTSHKAGANCVSCHMPKRRTDDAIHVVMTEHLITKRPPAGDLLAKKNERADTGADSYRGEVVPYYPAKLPTTADNELTIAVAQVREQANLTKGLPQLARLIEKYRPNQPAYYAELAEGYLAAGNTALAIQFFEQAAKRDPQSGPRLIEWGDALMQTGQWALAEAKLRRATELAPDDVRAWGRLGWTLWQQNKAMEARAALEKGIGLDPEVPELHNNLGLLLLGTGDQAGAENEFRAAIRIQPGVAEWRLTLARLLASQGDTSEASYQLEQSLRSKPNYAEARIVYAHVLADMNRLTEAETQAKLAVQNNPSSADGHELWGGLLAAKGDLSGARGELSEALRLQPENGRARVQLGMVLANLGDRAGAMQHLSTAAQSLDSSVRAAAEQALRTLNAR